MRMEATSNEATSEQAASSPEPLPVTAVETKLQEQRRTLLSDEPLVLGALWARDWCESLQTDQRAVRGGWPGTLPEARTRALRYFEPELHRRGMRLLSTVELAAVTSAIYDRAKRDWLLAVRALQPASVGPVRRRNRA